MGRPFIIPGFTTVPGFDLEYELHKHVVEASSEARAQGKHVKSWSEIIRLLEHRGKAVDSVLVHMLPAATVNWVKRLEQATLPPTVAESHTPVLAHWLSVTVDTLP